MCRIAGIINTRQDASLEVKQMCNAMRRGGPDDEGFWEDPELGIYLGHRRLSIIDLSEGGHQPKLSEDGRYVICYNGELYNYLEIREELVGMGVKFSSQSDTEVMLKAFIQWGKDCFSRFNGMYAVCLVDRQKGKTFLIRDHAGIKPLYFSDLNGKLFFGSEVRSFRALGYWKTNPAWKTFFLAFGHLPEPVTMLEGLKPLPKGHYLEYDHGTQTYRIERFYFAAKQPQLTQEKDAVDAVRETLQAAVKRHLISDAPIGLFLSGGIDSSILTLCASDYIQHNLKTLSIYFDSEKYSEEYYQQLIIRKTHAEHSSFKVSAEDLEHAFSDILEAMDSPSIDGVNSYFICRYARQAGLKAVLSGLGADELLGGYQSFRRAGWVDKVRALPSFLPNWISRLPIGRLKRIGYLAMKNPVGEYLFYRGIFSMDEIARLLGKSRKEIKQQLEALPVPEGLSSLKGASRAGFFEYNFYMQNQLLRDTDYMGMWHGLEVRVPFLDRDFIDLCESTAPEVKFDHPRGKHLLIEAFKEVLPEEIWNRSKRGFTFPFEEWIEKKEGFLDTIGLSANEVNENLPGKVHWSKIWSLMLVKRIN